MKIIRNILLIVLSLFLHIHSEVSITELKGLSRSLQPEYQNVSPALGALFLLHNYVENLYRFGDDATSTVQLVKELFFVHHDGVTFDVTSSGTKIGRFLDSADLGKIVGHILSYQQAKITRDALINVLNTLFKQVVEQKDKEIKEVILQQSRRAMSRTQASYDQAKNDFSQGLSPEVQPIWTKLETEKGKGARKRLSLELNTLLTADQQSQYQELMKLQQQLGFQSKLLREEESVATVKSTYLLESAGIQPSKRIKPLAIIIADALDEEIGAKDQKGAPIYVQNNTINIFLSVLWKKSQSKDDFRLFLDQVRAITGIAFETFYTNQSLISGSFTQQDYERLKSFQPDQIKNLSLEDFIFALLGYALFGNELPKEVGMLEVGYQTFDGEKYSFPDCGETSLRNFFNALIYNFNTKKFDVEILKSLGASDNLIGFYTKYSTQLGVTTGQAHDDWAKIVSALPNVSYITGNICEINGGIENMLQVIGNLIPGVQTFEDLRMRLASNNINIQMKFKFYKPLNQKSDKENLITFEIQKPGKDAFELTWVFKPGHFNIIFPPKGTDPISQRFSQYFEENLNQQNGLQQSITCGLYACFEIDFSRVLDKIARKITNNTTIYQYLALLLRILDTFEKRTNIIPQLKNQFILRLPVMELFFANVRKSLPVGDIYLQSTFFKYFLNLNIPISDELYQKATEIANIATQNPNMLDYALDLFILLVGEGHGYNEAIDAAKIGMQSEDSDLQASALLLFPLLVERGQAYQEALEAAKKGIQSQSLETRMLAFSLFNNLFKKGQGYNEAIEAAKIDMQSEDSVLQRSGLILFRMLVEKDKAYQEAIEAAKRGMQSLDSEVLEVALILFRILVEKGQADQEALEVAKRGMQSNDKYVQKSFRELVETLKKKGVDVAKQ